MKSQSSRNSEIKLTRAVLSFKGNLKRYEQLYRK